MEVKGLRDNIMSRLKELNDLEPLSYLFESMQGEFAVLSLIAEMKQISPSEISNILNISKSRSTVILYALQKKGFISVSRSNIDKRKLNVMLTSLGEESIIRKNIKASTFFDDYLRELGEDEAQRLISFLDKSIKIARNKVTNNSF